MAAKADRRSPVNQYIRLGLALLILIGIAGGFALYLSGPLRTGRTLVLDTAPVDPFDPFRGQYIIIRYEISWVTTDLMDVRPGMDAYIILKEDDSKVWRFQSASLTPPKTGDFIRGKVQSAYGGQLSLQYGIEQYFFERRAELPQGKLTVEVKVDSGGQARISQLLIEGEPAQFNYQNFSLLA